MQPLATEKMPVKPSAKPDVNKIQRHHCAVDDRTYRPAAGPASRPLASAIRAIPATRATGMAMPVSSSPNNNRPTSDKGCLNG